MHETTVAVIGAGPAGLTAAYLLTKHGISTTVLETDSQYVGGIARTVQHNGFRFDVGGHRFFSKSQVVEDLWTEILPSDMLVCSRSSRIYYAGRFFSYPLQPWDALRKLGLFESARCILSYLRARARPIHNPRNLEDWVTNQFGSRLFNIFFKTYTEKVWGMSCREISADWAAQRIKGLSLITAILNAFRRPRWKNRSRVIKTLIDTFRYPRLGPGMLWEACADAVRAQGGMIEMGRTVTALNYNDLNRRWIVTHCGPDGETQDLIADHVVSSAPLRHLVNALSPRVSDASHEAATRLRYRDFLTVALMLKDAGRFPDNWVYIHDPRVKVGRIQNFKAWSPEMVPDPSLTCYGLEYFCFEGDGLWASSDSDLIGLATRELAAIGLANPADVIGGYVVRQPKAYPVYDDGYAERITTIRRELEEQYPNLHPVGRNGLHQYDNQDHAMMTAMLCVENIRAGQHLYDPWAVNQDAEYHEAGARDGTTGATGLRMVPTQRK